MTPVELATHMPALSDMNVLDENKHFLATFSPATSSNKRIGSEESAGQNDPFQTE
jgi:hypothetical protein